MGNYYMKRSDIRELCEIALMAAVLAVCSWISIPTTVPFTLQTFGVCMAIRLLGGKRGTVAIMLYLLIGLVGVPVFAQFASGPSAIIGPTGGYLVGFLLMSGLYWAFEKRLNSAVSKEAVLYAGLLLCYAAGTAWFVYVMGTKGNPQTIASALNLCVIPYMLPDIAKQILSALAARQVQRLLKTIRS